MPKRVRAVKRKAPAARRSRRRRVAVQRPVLSSETYHAVGTEVVTLLSTGTTTAFSKLYGSLFGASTVGSRLPHLARMFEKYRVNRLFFELKLVCPGTQSISVIQAFDTDPGDPDPNVDEAGVTAMASWRHNQTVTSGDPVGRLTVIDGAPHDALFTSYDPAGDLRLAFVGQYYVYLLSATATGLGVQVKVTYDIDFFEPQIETATTAAVTRGTGTAATNPPTYGAWDTVSALVQTLSTVEGVKVAAKYLGLDHTSLELSAGRYILQQCWKAIAGVTTYVGFTAPAINARNPSKGYALTNIIHANDIAGDWTNHTDLITVPPGQVLDVMGLFSYGGGYTETGTPECIVGLSRVA